MEDIDPPFQPATLAYIHQIVQASYHGLPVYGEKRDKQNVLCETLRTYTSDDGMSLLQVKNLFDGVVLYRVLPNLFPEEKTPMQHLSIEHVLLQWQAYKQATTVENERILAMFGGRPPLDSRNFPLWLPDNVTIEGFLDWLVAQQEHQQEQET